LKRKICQYYTKTELFFGFADGRIKPCLKTSFNLAGRDCSFQSEKSFNYFEKKLFLNKMIKTSLKFDLSCFLSPFNPSKKAREKEDSQPRHVKGVKKISSLSA
jgi:hypothetical protein